ncbi:MAG: hypothetical protein H6811_09860 [Phycisphaeraceae bacterium]|nr:hypothetical protein [Phycisphaeraceae bacterium]
MPAGRELREGYEVSPRDAHALISRGATLIDCRTDAEWVAVRLDGAVHIPLHELEARADEIEGEPVLVICHHGVRSLRAAMALQALGIDSARSVVGGIDLWSVVVDPSVKRYERQGALCRIVD